MRNLIILDDNYGEIEYCSIIRKLDSIAEVERLFKISFIFREVSFDYKVHYISDNRIFEFKDLNDIRSRIFNFIFTNDYKIVEGD